MINEIKRRLDAGETVELECIDRNGFIRHDNGRFEESNATILSQDKLAVDSIGLVDQHIYLKGAIPGCQNCIGFEERKFFKIKESNFDDLVDKTIKAVRDYVAIITHLELDNITIESINYDLLSPLEIYREDAPEKIQKAIDWIDSLYTETFAIECEEDIRKITEGAKITLRNGIKITAKKREYSRYCIIYCKDDHHPCEILWIESLKDAIVTQRKGVS